MIEINGQPFIYYLLDQLAESKIERVVISTGYMAQTIEETVGSSYRSLHIEYSREEKPLGTGGALKLVVQAVNTNQCLVMNGDSYTQFDLASMLIFHKEKNAKITLLKKFVDDISRFGVIELNKQNEIEKFMEKGQNTGSGFINVGVYIMDTSIIQMIPNKTPCSLEFDFFPGMIGLGLYGFETKGKFIDIGVPESYTRAKKFFCEHLSIQA